MNTRPLLASLTLIVLFAVASPAYADMYSYNGVNYTIPSGYQSYSPGVFYNPNTGHYYNPVTGQTSTSPMLGTTAINNYNYGSYSVPQGYQSYNYGTYYNPSTGMYYNPRTGQSSAQAPIGPGSKNPNGSFVILPGYSYYAYGTYYNSGTNMFWDPETGFFSNSVPGPMTFAYNQVPLPVTQVVPVYVQTAPTYTVAQPVSNPNLPSTGAGGDAASSLVLLAISGLVAVGGIMSLRRLAYF